MPNTPADPTALPFEEDVPDTVSPVSDQITTNPQRMGGTPVLRGTRVPVDTLFDHLIHGYTVEYVAAQFGTVSIEQITRLLEDMKRTYNEPAARRAG